MHANTERVNGFGDEKTVSGRKPARPMATVKGPALTWWARLWAAILELLSRRPELPDVPELEPGQVAPRPAPARRSMEELLERRRQRLELQGNTPAGLHALQAATAAQLKELEDLVTYDEEHDGDGYRGAALAGLVARSPLGAHSATLSAAMRLLACWSPPFLRDVALLVVRPMPTPDQAMEALLLADELGAALLAHWQATGRRDDLVWRSFSRKVAQLRESFSLNNSAWIDRAELAREVLAYAPPAAGDLTLPLWRELATLDQVADQVAQQMAGAR